jgi:carbamoyl-phosphate synthase small subunit
MLASPGCPARLCLADGTVFDGRALGAVDRLDRGPATGEAVFTTGMTGYEEILTDPSYRGQIVAMTAPQIGNTGTNDVDAESVTGAPHVAALVVRDASAVASSWRANATLDAYLARHGVVALTGVDTRLLTRHLRDRGAMNAAIGVGPAADLVDAARAAPAMEGLDLVREVTPAAPYAFEEPIPSAFAALDPASRRSRLLAPGDRPHVVAMDFGAKRNILRCLVSHGCRVTVVPAHTAAADVLALAPDGVFVSNGPGDPAALRGAVSTLRELVGKKPLFGICLGHQLLARALGGTTSKLKFGHRGLNQPVLDKTTGRIEITSQNHGFVVDVPSLPEGVVSTHEHLNDGTSEGLEAPELGAFSVQYHPEAAAGPHDALYLFDRFVARMVGENIAGAHVSGGPIPGSKVPA